MRKAQRLGRLNSMVSDETNRKGPVPQGDSGSTILRPRARIIQTLGRDLIANEVVALQELIKNAYDADATKVQVTFHEPLLPKQGAIVLSDNGVGMDLSTIKSSWMEPATVSKSTETRTSRGRRVTGEKGIGRFAAARVAQTLELATVRKGSNERIRVRFEWSKFEDPTKYLDEVQCSWEVEPANKASAGTTLALSGLKDEWTEDRLQLLRGELARLIDPLTDDQFSIELVIPGKWKAFAGLITSPSILGKPRYRLVGEVKSSGELEAAYEAPNGNERILNEDGTAPVIKLTGGRIPACGPFRFEFRVWERQREELEPLAKELGSTLREIQRDLNSASGINVYRDKFRVLIPENDWLRLDLRRVQNPTMRLSNNQVVGRVFISADSNPGLKDQSNRQGIIDSPELEDFKKVLIDVLSRLEVRRDHYRRRTRADVSSPGIFEKLQFAPVRAYLLNRYPKDAELQAFLDDQTTKFQQGVGEVQQVLARYRRLATLGQLIDVVLHEGRTPLSTIKNEIALADDALRGESAIGLKEQLTHHLERIDYQATVLASHFQRLAPFSGRKRGRPVVTTIEALLAETFALQEERIKDLHIRANLPSTSNTVRVDPAEMQMIFLNLLENAIYWLDKVPESRREVRVEVRKTADGLEVLFADSGPGVPSEARDRIFEPYFSMKPDGVGLGLTIAGETASEYDGSLELVSDGPLPGATFRVLLRKRLGLENA